MYLIKHPEKSRILTKGVERTKHSITQIKVTHSRQMAFFKLTYE